MLYRLNARSADFELAFAAAEIRSRARRSSVMPRDSSWKGLRGSDVEVARERVPRLARRARPVDALPPRLGEREETRQKDLRLLGDRALVAGRDGGGYVDELRSRFASKAAGGVHLLTYHRAKGSSSTRSSCRAWSRASFRHAAPGPTTRSPRSGGSSTSASHVRGGT